MPTELVVGAPVGLIEGSAGRGHGIVDIFGSRVGGLSHHLVGSGVEDVIPLAGLGFAEFSIDEQAAFEIG
jgi:hypothetical protein